MITYLILIRFYADFDHLANPEAISKPWWGNLFIDYENKCKGIFRDGLLDGIKGEKFNNSPPPSRVNTSRFNGWLKLNLPRKPSEGQKISHTIMDCRSLENGENFREAFQVRKIICIFMPVPVSVFYINILFFVE